MNGITIPEDYALVSFDVKSLFTSIPLELAEESITSAINEDDQLMWRTSLSTSQIMELVKHCLQANIFQYDGSLYQQICGVPMGSPISVVIAEMTMQ